MFKEPLDAYFPDFGETVMFDDVEIKAIFDREYAADNGFGLAIDNADPKITVLARDLPSDFRSAIVYARGVAYAVAQVDFDGTGVMTIQLKVMRHDPPPY